MVSSTLKSDSASRLLNAYTAGGMLNFISTLKANNYFDTGRLDVSRPLDQVGEIPLRLRMGSLIFIPD